jgi:hypothetical protein
MTAPPAPTRQEITDWDIETMKKWLNKEMHK